LTGVNRRRRRRRTMIDGCKEIIMILFMGVSEIEAVC